MAEFDDKLNSILSDPEAMAKIAQLAQSLSGGTGEAAPPPPPRQADRRQARWDIPRSSRPEAKVLPEARTRICCSVSCRCCGS